MSDIAPGLLKAVEEDFIKLIENDRKIARILSKVERGTADYSDMYYYSTEVGECLEKALKDNINEDDLPDGRMYYNIADRVVRPMLEQADEMIQDVADKVQDNLNKKAGLGLKSV